MSELQGLFGFGGARLGVSPYAELADPKNNAVDRWLDRLVGAIYSRAPFYRLRLRRFARRVIALEGRFAELSDDQLRESAWRLRPRLLRRRDDLEALAEAFALVREAGWRRLGKRLYPVQIMGALALYEGRMVEMATGEGKTLTAVPAAVVAALSGEPVHIVTVNDYLAARDAEINRPVFECFGLSCGVIDSDMEPEQRRQAYACDLTYVSNKNLCFDYLRDRISLRQRRSALRRRTFEYLQGGGAEPLLLRGLAFAIVDEADSVFVDEARTPLILSTTGDDPEAARIYPQALEIARQLTEGRDYRVDRMNREVTLEKASRRRLETLTADLEGLWRIRKAREELVRQALTALLLFENGHDYLVIDGKVQIVDEFTGRIMPDRSWQAGLHQMIEAKEGVEITGEKRTLARITYQRFFRRYLRLAGMTGTATELAGEFRDTFGLLTVRIPTHRPVRRRHHGSSYLRTAAARWDRVAERAARCHAEGRPVLIGTRSVEASEQASAALSRRGLDHAVLNARQDEAEAEIIARAGEPGRITVATNMAGRGTDICLTEQVAARGGLHVILTEFHESGRIDRQLFGRCARQGDPGSVEAVVSLEDELFDRFAPRHLKLVRRLPLGLLCGWMRRHAQARAEREHAITRREQTKLDRQLEQALGFSGSME
ncbi:MAG: translocase [Gammaproteobacteria bacterium]|nr:MAG: translocase [Gammaproteobacteria bacterium]